MLFIRDTRLTSIASRNSLGNLHFLIVKIVKAFKVALYLDTIYFDDIVLVVLLFLFLLVKNYYWLVA